MKQPRIQFTCRLCKKGTIVQSSSQKIVKDFKKQKICPQCLEKGVPDNMALWDVVSA